MMEVVVVALLAFAGGAATAFAVMRRQLARSVAAERERMSRVLDSTPRGGAPHNYNAGAARVTQGRIRNGRLQG
jgi:hypothetical protein